jgi:hypothetical protein
VPAALGHELQRLQVGALARRHAGLGQRLRGVQVGLRRGHLRRLGQRQQEAGLHRMRQAH